MGLTPEDPLAVADETLHAVYNAMIYKGWPAAVQLLHDRMIRAAHAYYDGAASNLDVSCPKCHAPTGQHCKTLTTNKTTDTHQARINARWS